MGLALWSLLLCSLAVQQAVALYGEGDNVVLLDEPKFNKLVMKTDGVAAVEFFAAGCKRCKEVAPLYKEVAKKLDGLALVGAVDCGVEANKPLCKTYLVRRYPDVKFFGTERMRNQYTKKKTKEVVDYDGPNTTEGILEGIYDLFTNRFVKQLKSKEVYDAFLEKAAAAGKAAVVLATTKTQTTSLYEGLSMQLRKGLAFGEVHSSVESVVEALGLSADALPSIVVIKADGALVRYAGETRAPAIKAFLEAYAKAPSSSSKAPAADTDAATAAEL